MKGTSARELLRHTPAVPSLLVTLTAIIGPERLACRWPTHTRSLLMLKNSCLLLCMHVVPFQCYVREPTLHAKSVGQSRHLAQAPGGGDLAWGWWPPHWLPLLWSGCYCCLFCILVELHGRVFVLRDSCWAFPGPLPPPGPGLPCFSFSLAIPPDWFPVGLQSPRLDPALCK